MVLLFLLVPLVGEVLLTKASPCAMLASISWWSIITALLALLPTLLQLLAVGGVVTADIAASLWSSIASEGVTFWECFGVYVRAQE
jgi:hypothetical protein